MREYLLQQIEILLQKIKDIIVSRNLSTKSSTLLYEVVRANLGVELTPKDEVPDEVACMSTMNALHKKAFGEPIGGDASTYLGYLALKNNKNWVKVVTPLPGDVVISPSGFGGKNGVTNGHVGCYLGGNKIASNNSQTGLLDDHLNLESWRQRYVTLGGYPIWFFRKIF